MKDQTKFKVREFEWFEMETRVRQMVQQLITPFQKRLLQNSTSIASLKNLTQQQSVKLQQFRQMITSDPDNKQIDAFRHIQRKFEQQKLELLELRNMALEQGKMFENRFVLQDQRLKENSEILLNNMQLKERVNEEMRHQNQNIEALREKLQALIIELSKEVAKNHKEQQDQTRKEIEVNRQLEKRVTATQNTIHSNDKIFGQLSKQFTALNSKQIHTQQQLTRLQSLITSVNNNLTYTKKSANFLQQLQQKLRVLQFNISTLVPLITQAQIGDTLYNILPSKLKRRLIVHEHEKNSKLNTEVLQKDYKEVLGKFRGMQLIEMVQKRNTRELIEMKRKKLAAMGVDVDNMSYEMREKWYRDVSLFDQDGVLEEDDEPMRVKPTVDEEQVNALIKQQLEDIEKTLKTKLESELKDSKQYILGAEEQLHKIVDDCTNKVQRLQSMSSNFQTSQLLQNKHISQSLSALSSQLSNHSNQFHKISQTLTNFIQFCSLVNHLQIQDQLDKQSISLLGVKQSFQQGPSSMSLPTTRPSPRKIVDFNPQCFSCCGYPASTIAAFKMACLSYSPSEIIIQEREYKREEVLEIATKILQWIKSRLGEVSPTTAGLMMSQEGSRSEVLQPQDTITAVDYSARKSREQPILSSRVQMTEVDKEAKTAKRTRRLVTSTMSTKFGASRVGCRSANQKDPLPTNISYIFAENKKKNLAFLN